MRSGGRVNALVRELEVASRESALRSADLAYGGNGRVVLKGERGAGCRGGSSGPDGFPDRGGQYDVDINDVCCEDDDG